MIIVSHFILHRLHGATVGGAMKVVNMQVFEIILRRSLECSQRLGGLSTGTANFVYLIA